MITVNGAQRKMAKVSILSRVLRVKEAEKGTHEEYLGAGFLLRLKKLNLSVALSTLDRGLAEEREGVSERDPGVSGGSCVTAESTDTISLRFLGSDCTKSKSKIVRAGTRKAYIIQSDTVIVFLLDSRNNSSLAKRTVARRERQ